MREIKYRAWLKNGKWMEDVVEINFYDKTISYIEDDYINTEQRWIEEAFENIELMQFTGLHDKNGAEIYEGDILELINDSGRRILAICKFGSRRLTTKNRDMIDIQCFYFEVEGRKTNPMVCNYKGVHDLEIMEVIGNIYDNPELLESEE